MGKSTVVSKVVLRLKSAGIIVGGCTTAEKKSGGTRVGFEVRDLTSGRTGELASVTSKFGPKVGRYTVYLTDLAGVVAAGVEAAAASSELVVIDEVGPMELVSPEFRRAVSRCMDAGKPLLAVVHEWLEDDIRSALWAKAESLTGLTVENRDDVADDRASRLLAAVGGPK